MKGGYVKVYHHGPGPTCPSMLSVQMSNKGDGPITHEMRFPLTDGLCYAGEGLAAETGPFSMKVYQRKSDYVGHFEVRPPCKKHGVEMDCPS